MRDLFLNPDQIMKQEQYKDLLREAERYRLAKAATQREPKYYGKVIAALRKLMAGLTRHVASLRPMILRASGARK
jgi:hypothetical protein